MLRDFIHKMDDGTPKLSYAEPTKYDSIYWVEVNRIEPNPFQPRREFDEDRLRSLSESIRQYGVLQPLVVTRKDVERSDGGLTSLYELIAGERRLRASKLAGLREVPVVIRVGEQTDHMKLELAIVENLQREDLNSIDRAKSLAQLSDEFGLSHAEIGAKVGRSREFVTNSIRLLMLPDAIQQGVVDRQITEGHARALLMLNDRKEEQNTLFKEILLKKTSVRMVEQLARRIAHDKIRKHDKTYEMMELEKSLTESLGTRVIIENRPNGGRLLIEFFSPEDLTNLATMLAHEMQAPMNAVAHSNQLMVVQNSSPIDAPNTTHLDADTNAPVEITVPEETAAVIEPQPEEVPEPEFVEDEDLYAVRTFSL
jgi:ParB family chromosome partitioning protein